MLLLSIDPGLAGAVAFFPPYELSSVYDMPVVGGRVDAKALHQLLCLRVSGDLDILTGDCHCFLEQSQPMPGQGVTSMFHYGMSYGVILGALAALDIPYTEVRPWKWKRALGLGKDKEQARLRAMQLFPHCDLHRKRDHGRAEALLIGWYGSQTLQRHTASDVSRLISRVAPPATCIAKKPSPNEDAGAEGITAE